RRRGAAVEQLAERQPRRRAPKALSGRAREGRPSAKGQARSGPVARTDGGTVMTYAVKEIFKTLQGEGAQAGRAAVFCRFAGCNLWSGREIDRASAACTFCDTDFVGTNGTGGGKFGTAVDLATTLAKTWGPDRASRYVVFTGGEPL